MTLLRIRLKRSLASLRRISPLLTGVLLLFTVGFLSIYGSKSRAEASRPPRPQMVAARPMPPRKVAMPAPRPLTAKERKGQDEAAILLEVLRDSTREAGKDTYVGIQREKDIMDPGPEMMRALLADNPHLRPASDLLQFPQAKPGTVPNTGKIWRDTTGKKPRFVLLAAGYIRWKSANQVEVSSLYLSSGGGFSHIPLQAFREGTIPLKKTERASKNDWILRRLGRGCGVWESVTITQNAYGR